MQVQCCSCYDLQLQVSNYIDYLYVYSKPSLGPLVERSSQIAGRQLLRILQSVAVLQSEPGDGEVEHGRTVKPHKFGRRVETIMDSDGRSRAGHVSLRLLIVCMFNLAIEPCRRGIKLF